MIQIITRYGNLLLLAMGQTLLLALCGLFFACILGMFFGLLSVLKNKACRIISSIFVDVIRGVPMIVLAYFIYFGVPYCLNNMMGFNFTLTALQAGTVCLALNCGAYMAEIIRAGILSVDSWTDGSRKKSWSSIFACHDPCCTSTGNPHHDSKYHQPVHHHTERYLYSFCYRFPGTGQYREKCCCQFLYVFPDMGYCRSYVPDRNHDLIKSSQNRRKETEPWP